MTIKRFSSRTEKLDTEFLAQALEGAVKYYRIAGYFRSSIFELVGEEIAKIDEVKIVCNSEIDINDFMVASGRDTAIKEKWNKVDVASDSLVRRNHYHILDQLLSSGKVEIRVVPKEQLFLHGKAGSIDYPDGARRSFIGSVNESKSAFASNYEIVWQDDDPKSADWVEEEFWELWKSAIPLPEAIVEEIRRVANRKEVSIKSLDPLDVPQSAVVESPIYRGGEQLQPWQRSFVAMFLQHREIYGKARLLLADEVGVGKTLSMATSALVSALLGDGAVLILSPSTLTFQWQVEMKDKLGIPTAVWSSQKKVWINEEGHILSPKGDRTFVKRCPYRIGIVSTGLVMQQRAAGVFVKEAGMLLERRYGTVILDEAHKARKKGGLGEQAMQPNNLLAFMCQVAKKSKNIILGTATPIQTSVSELWNLLEILNTDAQFVLGDKFSFWRNQEQAIPVITGKKQITSQKEAWQWLQNPFPPSVEHPVIADIRSDLAMSSDEFDCTYQFEDLDYIIQSNRLSECLEPDFFTQYNPVLRHVVLRKRKDLEEQNLLKKVGVNVHPLIDSTYQYQSIFSNLAILTNNPFRVAYEKAEEFCQLLQTRTKVGGFIKTLMLQRICSSFASGLKTAQKMLEHDPQSMVDDINEIESDRLLMSIDNNESSIDSDDKVEHILTGMSPEEVECLKIIQEQLSRPEAVDPKFDAVKWFLSDFRVDGKTWLEHGCIIFSQYYDTVEWVADELAKHFKDELIAVYAGVGKSKLLKGQQSSNVKREIIKDKVKDRKIKLLVATDAACEGLNLQSLGTLINIDLPWNPSRLEQRLGRIKRYGQARNNVDMLNLVYSDTQDEKIYSVLSGRLKDTYDIFGSLPDTIEDEWTKDVKTINERLNIYLNERENAKNAFDIRYNASVDPNANRWELCSKVLSRRDIADKLNEPW